MHCCCLQEAVAEPTAEGQPAGVGRCVAGRGHSQLPPSGQTSRHHSGTASAQG